MSRGTIVWAEAFLGSTNPVAQYQPVQGRYFASWTGVKGRHIQVESYGSASQSLLRVDAARTSTYCIPYAHVDPLAAACDFQSIADSRPSSRLPNKADSRRLRAIGATWQTKTSVYAWPGGRRTLLERVIDTRDALWKSDLALVADTRDELEDEYDDVVCQVAAWAAQSRDATTAAEAIASYLRSHYFDAVRPPGDSRTLAQSLTLGLELFQTFIE